ncbi:MAG: type II secretion system protein [Candidatus Aureabacteria bacterium]|nr:type II secretion system protein [Candidatus Auribacterota bacterium]
MKNKKNFMSGFSLIELIAVIGLILLFFGLTAPYFGKMNTGVERHGAINTVASMIKQARQLAISKNEIHFIQFFPDPPVSTAAVISDSTKTQIGRSYFLPKKLRFDKNPLEIKFSPRGNIISAVSNIDIDHVGNPGVFDRIELIASTGQVKITKDTN